MAMISIEIPESLKEEHDEIFSVLNQYAKLDDSTGRSIRTLLNSLEPHLAKEDELVMPLLGLIQKAAMGSKLENQSNFGQLYQRFRVRYKKMVAEHAEIRKRIDNARDAAKAERHRSIYQMLDALEHHTRIEDEVLYPAALMVGATLLVTKVAIVR